MNSSDIAAMLRAVPRLEDIKRALFIQPHPDDNQIAAGGTIAKLVSMGAEVWELTVTDDRFSSAVVRGSAAVTMRQNEALAAQAVLGMKNAGFLGFSDKTRASIDEIAAAILPVIRRIRPDAVFSADPTLPDECHSDHIRVGQAVRYCVMDSGCTFFPDMPDGRLREDAWEVPVLGLYYTDRPNAAVDITPFRDIKRRSIEAHASQVNGPFLDLLAARDEYLADGSGFAAAERLRLLNQINLHCFAMNR